MKKFSDFGIKIESSGFSGDKIKMDKVLNRSIVVHDYKVADSKFKEKHPKCLYLQISMNGIKFILFSGSKILIETIEKVPKEGFPFSTVIIKENEHFEFS